MIALKQSLLSEIPGDKRSRFILFLIFLFPILIATVKGASSLILLLLLIVSFGNFRNNWEKLYRTEQAVLLGLVFLVSTVALSLLMTEDLSEGSSKLERYLRLVLIIPIYFALRMKNIDSAKVFLLGIFTACFVMAGQAFYEVEILKNDMVFGAYHRIVFGDMAVLYASLLAIAWLFLPLKGKNIFIVVAAIMAGSYAALLSGSRSALLFIPLALVIVLFLYRQKLSRKAWLIIAGGLILLTVIAGTQQTKFLDGVKQGIVEIENYQQDSSVYTSWGARLNMWYNSWQVFKGAPVFGTGLGDYHTDVQSLLSKGMARADGFAEKQTNTHSIYFQTLAEGGVIGIILLLAGLFILPVRFFYYHWKNATVVDVRLYSITGLMVLAGFAWFGVSEGWLNRNPMVNSYVLLLVVFMSSIANKVKPIRGN